MRFDLFFPADITLVYLITCPYFFIWYDFFYLFIVFSIFSLSFRVRHSEEYCSMYDICGKRTDGKVLNCPRGTPSVKVYLFFQFLIRWSKMYDFLAKKKKKIRCTIFKIFLRVFLILIARHKSYTLSSSQMICFRPRSKVCVQQLLEMFVVQKLSLIRYGLKSNK